MKPLIAILGFYCAASALGQINYQSITPTDLNEEIKARAAARWTSAVEIKFIGDVIDSGRQELIAVCFQNASTRTFTIKTIVKMPKGIHFLRAAITLLRTHSGYWPDDDNPGGRGGNVTTTPEHLLVEPFISTMAQLLPDEKLELRQMMSTKERLQLADRLERELEKKYPATNPSSAGIPFVAVPASANAPSVILPEAAEPPVLPASSEVGMPTEASENGLGKVFWIPLIGAIILSLWILIRKTR